MDSYINKAGGEKGRVLVIAPHFPALNQSWMDTYLEQLLANGLTFSIISLKSRVGAYQEKVDRLKLRDRVLCFSLFSFRCGFLLAVRRPVFMARSLMHCKEMAHSVSVGGKAFWASLLKFVYFDLHGELFKGFRAVHAHEETVAYQFLHLALLKKIPLILTFHGLPLGGTGQLSANKRRVLYDLSTQVIVNTNFALEQVVSLGCDRKKVKILPQGLVLEDFDFSPLPCPNRDEALILLTVGRFHLDKGQEYALQALRGLIDSGVQAHYHLVGVGDEGRVYLERVVSQLSLGENVTFHQNLPTAELRVMYRKSHIFILPSVSSVDGSHEETQGVVLQEAQASGCIPIATKVGGIVECLNDKVDAILVNDRSSSSILDAVIYLLERPVLWSDYQKSGRENVEKNFSAVEIGEKMSRLLQGLGKGAEYTAG